MLESKIKEEISLFLFSTLAARMGYAAILPRFDQGTDIIIKKSTILTFGNRKRYTTGGQSLSIQMKTTTTKQVKVDGLAISYNLEVKNYNDLIFRKNEWVDENKIGNPLILILHVLPEKPQEWLKIDFDKQFYQLNGLFYWFFPDNNDKFTDNKRKSVVKIPTANKVDLNFFPSTFQSFFQ